MLGIIGAMDQEVSILKEKMEVKKIDKRASMEFYVGILRQRGCYCKMRCRQGQCCCLHTDSCRLLSGRSG